MEKVKNHYGKMNTLSLATGHRYGIRFNSEPVTDRDQLHYHDFYEIFISISGEMKYEVEQKSFDLCMGDVLFIPPRAEHRPIQSGLSGSTRCVLQLDASLLEDLLDGSLPMPFSMPLFFKMDPSALSRLINLIQQLQEEQTTDALCRSLMERAILAQIMILLIRNCYSLKSEAAGVTGLPGEVLSKPDSADVTGSPTAALSKPDQADAAFSPTAVLSKSNQADVAGSPTAVLSKPDQADAAGPPTAVLSKSNQADAAFSPTAALSKSNQADAAFSPTALSKSNQADAAFSPAALSKPNQADVTGSPAPVFPESDAVAATASVAAVFPESDVAVAAISAAVILPRSGQQGSQIHSAAIQLSAFMDAHFAKEISLQQLSRRLGVERTRLSREFRQIYGLSPHEYLMNRRLTAAREIILAGTPPTLAAAQSGFRDYSNFYRQFHRKYGTAPSQFLK